MVSSRAKATIVDPSGSGEVSHRETVLVYRDRIVPRSEAHFLRRLYLGFDRLVPVWVGCRTGDGLADLGYEPVLLGRSGPVGAIDRALFKQFGVLPRQPDLRALRPRIVHAHFGRGGALALPIARALGVPLVVTFHGGDATKDKHYRRPLVPTIFQRRLAALQKEAALFICVSDFIRDQLVERGFPKKKLRVIRYGVETDDSSPAEPPPARPYVLFVGRFVEKKGITHLIEAMRLLEGQGSTVQLALIGDGSNSEDLRRQARSLQFVDFKGWLPNDEVRRWMRGAIAVCVPSVASQSGDREGLPNVVLEAMAAGTPVIGTHHAGIGEAVEHGRTGFLLPPGDPRALADALKSLIEAPATRKAMGDNARLTVAHRFSAIAQSRLLEDTLLEIMNASCN